MGKVVLVDEGVFPITKLANGTDISGHPKTGWHFPGTVQGEGKLAGVPSLFIRLASCNLRCIWTLPDGKLCSCDTAYASFHPDKTNSWQIQEIVDTVRNNIGSMNHVVITGGEPLLQKESLAELCAELKQQCQVHITVETNGTLFSEAVAQHVDLVSISPKLKNSEPAIEKIQKLHLNPSAPFKYHAEVRKQIEVLQQWIDYSKKQEHDFQLKFVVAHPDETKEIQKEYLDQLHGWQGSDILLMPLGMTNEELAQSTPVAVQMAVTNGWRYTPRVHIELFGCKSGV